MVLGPPWTRGLIEKPLGVREQGTWTSLCYTAEQMARLGVDESGVATGTAMASAAPGAAETQPVPSRMLGLAGPAWTRGEAERPAGEKDMGGWNAAAYTEEQQARLGVDECGESRSGATPPPHWQI
mmetsp:Transcript_43279/g.106859  ORF Transcript_43279/g.106859 Transcript_43279/m.106859 type:complete len:126 (+) Transcript_43279:148-525(+)